jgi:hypothetical protein
MDYIKYVEIQKVNDTVALRLTDDQVKKFINEWNSSTPKGPYKYLSEYVLTVHFKGDSSLSFRTNKNLIKQRSDWAYSVGDKDFFKNIWYKQAGLTEDYFEYFPTYFLKDEYSFDRNPLEDKHRKAIKLVLTYFNHKWTDIRGQIFYKGKIDNELLWNYTTKANDSSWLLSHR